jgi:hypothetical protein
VDDVPLLGSRGPKQRSVRALARREDGAVDELEERLAAPRQLFGERAVGVLDSQGVAEEGRQLPRVADEDTEIRECGQSAAASA